MSGYVRNICLSFSWFKCLFLPLKTANNTAETMYPSQITICHWAGPFVNEMKTRAMKRALRFAVATERHWTQTITQLHNQLRGNSWRWGDEMRKEVAGEPYSKTAFHSEQHTSLEHVVFFQVLRALMLYWTHKQSCPSALWLNEKRLSERLWRINTLEPESESPFK